MQIKKLQIIGRSRAREHSKGAEAGEAGQLGAICCGDLGAGAIREFKKLLNIFVDSMRFSLAAVAKLWQMGAAKEEGQRERLATRQMAAAAGRGAMRKRGARRGALRGCGPWHRGRG